MRRGEARRGEARRGAARRGEVRRGEARRGEARRGEARRAPARTGRQELSQYEPRHQGVASPRSGGSPGCWPAESWPRQLGQRGDHSLDSAHSRCHRLRLPLRAGGGEVAAPCHAFLSRPLEHAMIGEGCSTTVGGPRDSGRVTWFERRNRRGRWQTRSRQRCPVHGRTRRRTVANRHAREESYAPQFAHHVRVLHSLSASRACRSCPWAASEQWLHGRARVSQ